MELVKVEDQLKRELEQLLSALDASQRLAVCEDPSRPLLILAGAGSGKTLTMASRIAFLLLHGVAPEHILGLCFSRHAAEALRDRVAAVLPPSMKTLVERLKLKTFHAFGLECLRRYGCIDLTTEVYDARRQRELAAAVVEAHAVHSKSLEAVLALVDYVNKAKTRKEMRAGAEIDPSRQAAYLFPFYQTMLHEQHHAVDFGDLEQMLLDALRPVKKGGKEEVETRGVDRSAISNNNSNSGGAASTAAAAAAAASGGGNDAAADNNSNNNNNDDGGCALPSRVPSPVALQLQWQYTHIVVDEFQDLNEVQLECLALLAGDMCRVTCVGDPNQCIYSWRGATTNSFERWRSRFPQAKLVNLEVNYRSSAEIVNAVNAVVRLSQRSFNGQCGRRIALVRCSHASEQLPLLPRVVEEILRARDHSLTYGDIAILCRTRRTVRDVVAAVERDHIPVREMRSSKPNSMALVRAMLSFLRLCVHPHSNLDLECVIRDAPNHFSAPAATKFIFALQAESLQRRRQLPVERLQGADSHAAYSHYTILRELVHNGFAHVHDRLRTTKTQQKTLRTLIEVITTAHSSLGQMYCDIEEVVRGVAERAGFDEGSATGVKIRCRAASGGVKRQRHSFPSSQLCARRSAAVWGDVAAGDDDDDSDETDTVSDMSIPQLLVEACRSVQRQVLAEKSAAAAAAADYDDDDAGGGGGDNMAKQRTNVGGSNGDVLLVKEDACTVLQRVVDEFLALLPTDDFGPLQGGSRAELRPAAVTVTTVHQAKGKEWPAVVVPCCYEGEFPIDVRSAEEKRVFYVAMSRAMRDLVFLTAESGPSAASGHKDAGGGGGGGGSEEQPLRITPYLLPILPLIETVSLTCYQQQQRVNVESER